MIMTSTKKRRAVGKRLQSFFGYGQVLTVVLFFLAVLFGSGKVYAQNGCSVFDPSGQNVPASGGGPYQKTLSVVGCCDMRDYSIGGHPSWITNVGFFGIGNQGQVTFSVSPNSSSSSRSGTIILVYDGAGIGGGCSTGSSAGRIDVFQSGAPACTKRNWYLDRDGDGYYPSGGTRFQCDSPGTGWTTATKQSGDCDDADSLEFPGQVWYRDADNDGYYPSGGRLTQCLRPSGSGWGVTVKTSGDCDDGDPLERPGRVWYLDADGDGHYPSGGRLTQCLRPSGSGWGTTTKTAGDCNDSNASIIFLTWYLDADGDGYYPTNGTRNQCTSPGTGWTTTTKQAGDCNDTPGTGATFNPNTIWYLDADGDGYYPTNGTRTQCASPGSGWTTTTKQSGDCDDTPGTGAAFNPGTVWYLDVDGDGYYPANGIATQCAAPAGSGWGTGVKTGGDCNDGDAALNPNTLWYEDNDGDGFADPGGQSVQQCEPPSGDWTTNGDLAPCSDLISGTGTTPTGVTVGSFEGALATVVPNGRNETLGASGWSSVSGTPDTFLPPYDNGSDYVLTSRFGQSPNGGVVAGALRVAATAETLATEIDGLVPGETYIVEFFQANASRVLLSALQEQQFGYWNVYFAGEMKRSTDLTPENLDVKWYRDRVEFTANSTSAQLRFEVESTTNNTTQSLPVYMLLDGVRVYTKPGNGEPSYSCSDISVAAFCSADGTDPRISDLNAPFANTAGWFSLPEGGERYFDSQELSEIEGNIIWADDGSDAPRRAVEIVFDEGAPSAVDRQFFDSAIGPTLSDIAVSGDGVAWFASFAAINALDENTLLTDGTTYYAGRNGFECRTPVTVFVSAPQPLAEGYQEFCSTDSPTLADVSVTVTDAAYTLQWFGQAAGGAPLPLNTPLVNETTYYVVQDNGSVLTSDRLPISVSIIDVEASAKVYRRDVRFGTNSTIDDLSDFFGFDANVLWYDSLTGGNVYRDSDVVSNETYYARTGQGICAALEIFEVSVTISEIVDPELVRCVKFVPQPGDRYVISGWVREEALAVAESDDRTFNNEPEAKQAFIRLLEHIALKTVVEGNGLVDNYVLKENPDAPNVDALVPYIKDAVSKNVTVYGFRYETETVGGHERAVGFSFALAPGGTAERFVFLTPYVTVSFGTWSSSLGLNSSELDYRYPLRNEFFSFTFEDVAVTGNKFVITSEFKVPAANNPFSIPFIGAGGLNLQNTTPSTTDSGIEASVTFNTFREVDGVPPLAYENTRIELSYTKENGDPLVSDSNVLFSPKGAVIDGWQRISGDFVVPGLANSDGGAATMTITLKTSENNINAYFDDVRMHPFESNLKSFVYDPFTQRLMAELDENNYATFYEYDIEGGLVRVKKETERGVYTIQETRSGNSKLTKPVTSGN